MQLVERHARFLVYDDVLPDPASYRAFALTLPTRQIVDGEHTFQGIAPTADRTLPALVEGLLPDGSRGEITFFRVSPALQAEPHYLHTDADMGDWTGILYLHPTPPAGDGTSFWQRCADGAIAGPPTADMRDLEAWRRWHHVDAKYNRLLIFKADGYHSRGLYENYGAGSDARLIQVVFGRGPVW